MLKQLAGQTAIYGLGTIVPRFLNYLLFPYLTRVMTVGEYGVVTDLYALIPFVLVLLTMGLETGYFRFAGKAGSEAEKRTIFSNVWGAVTAVSIVFSYSRCCLRHNWPGSWNTPTIRRTSGWSPPSLC